MGHCLLAITGAFHSNGGIAAVNRLTIRVLAEEGHHLDVFCLSESDDSPDERYVEPSRLSYRCFRGSKLGFVLAVWKSLWTRQYDYVIADHVNVASSLIFPKLLSGIRYAVWLHGVEVWPPKPDRTGWIGLKCAWKLIANSDFTKQQVALRSPASDIAVCHLALDPVNYSRALPPEPLVRNCEIALLAVNRARRKLETQVILHVGRMDAEERYKGQESLLKAMPHILQVFPQAQLVLVGDGQDRERLLSIAKSLPASAQGSVFMPGYVGNALLSDLYDTCYLFAMPSVGEGFGLAYLEAMSHAKPCLGGRVDATPYIIEDGTTGLLVDNPRSPEQVSEKIMQLLASPEKAHAMGMAGYRRARSYHMFPHFKKRFLGVLTA